jgi:hypothetical protein
MTVFELAAQSVLHLLIVSHKTSAVAGTAVPNKINDGISQIVALAADGGLEKPDSLKAILTDLVNAGNAIVKDLPPEAAKAFSEISNLLGGNPPAASAASYAPTSSSLGAAPSGD